MLKGKHIIVGITGSIAAYKAASLVRLLVKEGAEVKVVMTELAKQFITPLTLATLSKHPVMVEFYNPENGDWHSHVDMGLWADLYLIAPATANTLGKMAHGIADNLLLTTYLSAKCPVMVAPAMDLDMYRHPATRQNLHILQSYGVRVIEPAAGELASGLVGKGRMAEPEEIVASIHRYFERQGDLLGKKVLLTAGPTYEKIDPVRFIGNYSSGKMGFALAEECARRGAEVTLIAGPVQLKTQHSRIHRIDVESAQEMYEAAQTCFPTSDVGVLCAAVADFRPETVAGKKIKREKEEELTLHLQATQDIAASLGKIKEDNQLLVGFALETNNEQQNAEGKLERKNFDFIVLNSLNDAGAGFRHDTNKISIIDRKGREDYPLKPKQEVAQDIINHLIAVLTH